MALQGMHSCTTNMDWNQVLENNPNLLVQLKRLLRDGAVRHGLARDGREAEERDALAPEVAHDDATSGSVAMGPHGPEGHEDHHAVHRQVARLAREVLNRRAGKGGGSLGQQRKRDSDRDDKCEAEADGLVEHHVLHLLLVPFGPLWRPLRRLNEGEARQDPSSNTPMQPPQRLRIGFLRLHGCSAESSILEPERVGGLLHGFDAVK